MILLPPRGSFVIVKKKSLRDNVLGMLFRKFGIEIHYF